MGQGGAGRGGGGEGRGGNNLNYVTEEIINPVRWAWRGGDVRAGRGGVRRMDGVGRDGVRLGGASRAGRVGLWLVGRDGLVLVA